MGFFCYPKLSILGFLGFFGVKCYPFCQYTLNPIFIFSGVIAHLIAVIAGQSTPGIVKLVLVSAIAGSIATLFVVVVAYYTTMGSFRFGLDPDTYGIPVVTSSLDLVGAFTVILAMVLTGVI